MFGIVYRRILHDRLNNSRVRYSLNIIRNYSDRPGIARFVGPFYVFFSPKILTTTGTVLAFYLLFLFPLDPFLFNAREIKRINDEKTMNS